MTWQDIYNRARDFSPNITCVAFHSGVENWVKVYYNFASFHVDGSMRTESISDNVPEFVKHKFGWKEVNDD